MEDITIVTAFFDINRSNMKGFDRTNETYLSYFEFWARIQNKIVVFSDPNTIKKVREIRSKFGLLEQTETYIIEDYTKIDFELFNSIDQVMKNEQFINFHLQTNIPEAISSRYNYIMAIKAWCCTEAVSKGLASGMIAWLDFGFNYGGKFYRKENEFDFLWKYNFSNKIHLFQVNDLDNNLPFEIIRQNNSYIQGGEIVAPDFLWEELWQMVRENMLSLNRSGLADDDQILYLMSYRQKPDLFELHKCEWLGLFLNFSDQNFTFEKPKINKLMNILYKIKHPTEFIFIRKVSYSLKTFRYLVKSSFKD